MSNCNKILLISENFPPEIGGSGRWFWEIYSRLEMGACLVAAGSNLFAHDFDARHRLPSLRWPLTLDDWGILSFPSLKTYCRLFFLLRTAVRLHHIQAVHCGRGLPEGLLGWCAWKWFGIPYLCYVHGEELPVYHSSREYKILSQLVYTNANRIIVNSVNTQRSFAAHTGIAETVRIMHPGVNTTYFTPQAMDEVTRQQLGWSARRVILTVGRLQKRKGHDYVILAMKWIIKQVPNVLYAIVGDGEERAFLEDLVIAENVQDYVQFIGKVDDVTMLTCYQQCDLFVLANREVDGDFEGFGMVLVEAQACGKPVLTGNSGGTVETLIPDETGLVINAEDPENIAQAIVQLLSRGEKSSEMGRKGVEWVRRNLDWAALVARAESIFSELQN